MGAVEQHLKTLCCLGLPPESAMIAVVPLLHEIIPHGWSRMSLLESNGTIVSGYSENPATTAMREHMWRFMDDPSSPMSLWMSGFRRLSIGWSLHLQGRGWFETGWYREIEAPLDSCWLLGAMIGDGRRTVANVNLTRPRSARRFTVEDVQRLDRVRPWLGHAFRSRRVSEAPSEDHRDLAGMVGAPVLSGQMILTADATVILETASIDHLIWVLTGERTDFTPFVPRRDKLPAPILTLLARLNGTAKGTSNTPPRMVISTAYGTVTLEARWLMPVGANPADVAKDPKSCLIAVTIELRENPIAHAARILRESGATPAQIKVGVELALSKGKPAIADNLGIKVSSVRDLTEKLYQTLDVHNSTELGAKIWLGQKHSETRQIFRCSE